MSKLAHMLLLDNLLKTQPKLLPKNLTFRPLSEAFIRRSWYSVLPVLDTTGRLSFDDVTRINFRFRLLVTLSSPRRRGASSHIIWCKISLSSPKLLFLRNWRRRSPPSWIFSLCEFGHSGVLAVWYLCSVPNVVQISVIVTEIDTHMLQTFIWWRHAN